MKADIDAGDRKRRCADFLPFTEFPPKSAYGLTRSTNGPFWNAFTEPLSRVCDRTLLSALLPTL